MVGVFHVSLKSVKLVKNGTIINKKYTSQSKYTYLHR